MKNDPVCQLNFGATQNHEVWAGGGPTDFFASQVGWICHEEIIDLTIPACSDTFSPMEQFLVSHGYPALFAMSFLASTLIPLGSEWLLVAMLLNRSDPLMTVAVATLGNTLGAGTTWAIGIYGSPFLIRRVLRIDAAAEASAARFYRRYGVWTLLFSWLPVIGDPLCLAGGILKVGFSRFSLLVFAGKLARYAVLTWLTLGGMQIFSR
jgi:membrane protein YqaA with SNARE-associated domain